METEGSFAGENSNEVSRGSVCGFFICVIGVDSFIRITLSNGIVAY